MKTHNSGSGDTPETPSLAAGWKYLLKKHCCYSLCYN